MKLRILLLSLLFVISSALSAVHELEHINPEHNSSYCQICVLDDNSLSFDLAKSVLNDLIPLSISRFFENQVLNLHIKKTNNHANAPPHIS